MDPVKVQAIHDWTQPTSLKSLQKFLGFANFYRRFICNFSSVAKPLTDLTKKGADLVNWSSAAVEAFQELKRRFSSAPVLCQPDVSLPFQVEVDASEIGAGAVLSQRGSGCSVMKPCAFFSRKFSPAERNYDVGNRELLAMKWAFEEWRHWLEGAKHRVTNGQTERTNQTLETYLRCFVSADQDDWVSFLPLAEFALNNRASSATLVSPFFCNSGFHPRFSSGQVESSDCPGVDTVVDRLQQIWTQVVDNLTLSQEKAQLFANCRRRVGPRLRVGDLVWLSSRHIPMKVSSPKFKPRFIACLFVLLVALGRKGCTSVPLVRYDGRHEDLCSLCVKLWNTLDDGSMLGKRCKRRSHILKTLYKLVDVGSDRLGLILAKLILELRVSGKNLLNICKLVFKISRSENNDCLFQSDNMMEMLEWQPPGAAPSSRRLCALTVQVRGRNDAYSVRGALCLISQSRETPERDAGSCKQESSNSNGRTFYGAVLNGTQHYMAAMGHNILEAHYGFPN
ncbi:unnamed protein product [Ranitomeya imitator]|uniref:Reverse transcriptase/retrotransposon-derived protein RNase H-like domain-containing protein n=1 Tax=Ranitomeya imitator TaxID=111125 RepID=A0ABN9L8G8_9NEOB|nr:unnamed protein product [Ranitomeya imitator]